MKRYSTYRPPVPIASDDRSCYIPLTRGQFALVDADQFEMLNQWNWFAWWSSLTQSFYAVRNQKHPRHGLIRMHHIVLGLKPGERGDHQSRNRRQNLRLCTRGQNACNRNRQKNNTSGFIGVAVHKKTGQIIAYLYHAHRRIHLGTFASTIEAAIARDAAAVQHHGVFASLNFPIKEGG